MEYLFYIGAFFIGAVLSSIGAWLLLRSKNKYALQQAETKSESERAVLMERLNARDEQILDLKETVTGNDETIHNLQKEILELKTSETELQTRIEDERKVAKEKLEILDDAQKKLSNAFKALSAEADMQRKRIP